MALSNTEMNVLLAQLREQADLQAEISGSFNGYLEGLKKAKALRETIAKTEKAIAKAQLAASTATGAELIEQENIIQALQKQNGQLAISQKLLQNNLRDVNKTKLTLTSGLSSIAKTLSSIPNLVDKGFGKIKGFGLFEMDKAIKKSALSMGLMGDQSKNFSTDIKAIVDDTLSIGVGIEELAKFQSDYSQELGRSVMLGQDGMKAMANMAQATVLGAEGAADMAASMYQQGLSAERTAGFVEEVVNDAHKGGLNASKVLKSLQQNMKLLNKYNFKGGVKGLEDMVKVTTKLGIEMESVTGMADKLFDIDGAVEMSAQLQVMGGEWAKLSDPFHLMYMARNDMAGLTKEIGKAAESSVAFNKANGQFEISSLEMHRLRKIAEQTGVAYETLATAGKNARIQTEIKSQIGFDIDPEVQEFMANTAFFDKKGEAKIMLKSGPKLVKALTQSDISLVKAQIEQKKSSEEMAMGARSFDETIGNFFRLLKTKLFPVIEEMTVVLTNRFDGFVKELKDGKWLEKITTLGRTIGGWVTYFAKWAMDNPMTTAFLVGSAQIAGVLYNAATWVSNGLLLAQGFNAGAKNGGIISGLKNLLTGKGLSAVGGGSALKGLGVAGGLGLAGTAVQMITPDDGSTMSVLGNAVAGGLQGAALGSFLGPIGTALGGALGAAIGGISAYNSGEPAGDAIFNSPIHDGRIEALGSDYSKGRGVIQGGKITPIDNKDDLLAMKPGGPVDAQVKRNVKDSQSTKIEFGELKISGQLMLSTPNNQQVPSDLIENPLFIREITKFITTELQKNKNQVQKG